MNCMENEVEKMESNVIFKDDFERLETGDKWEFCSFFLTVLKWGTLQLKPTQRDADSMVRYCSPTPDSFYYSPPGLTREGDSQWHGGNGESELSRLGNIPLCWFLFTPSIIAHKHRGSSKLFPPFQAWGPCIIRPSPENTQKILWRKPVSR